MPTRRQFQFALGAGALLPTAACSGRDDMDAYNEANAERRAVLSETPEIIDYVRMATLAANGHNTQPWRFRIDGNGVTILPDLTRSTPAVDPDDHHLYVSLGCAAENFLIAAAAGGQPGTALFSNDGDGRISIDLGQGESRRDTLYDALPKRQSTRSPFDGKPVPLAELKLLERSATLNGVSLQLITDPGGRESVLEYVIEGNTIQMDDPAFVQELRDWIRFNPAEALRTGDGLFSASSGNPTLPTWLGRRLFGLFYEKKSETEKYTDQLRSSAGVAVFTGDRADRDHWIRVGRSFQRFALQATALGIRHSHINQPIEVPALRTRFADWLGTGGRRPDLVIRFGYAPPLPMSMRRPVEDVMISL